MFHKHHAQFFFFKCVMLYKVRKPKPAAYIWTLTDVEEYGLKMKKKSFFKKWECYSTLVI